MGYCIVAGGKPDMAAPVSYKANFADNDWATIIDACQKNTVPESWVVGSQKAMTINGTDYLIDIIGKNHDDYADGSGKAPLTFQMHDGFPASSPFDRRMNTSDTNVGGWGGSAMRIATLPAILATMPSEVQAGIREVNKLTSAGNQSSTINATADKLFLLSEIEVFGKTEYSYRGEGTQYDYFRAGNFQFGSLPEWWERSPHKGSNSSFCMLTRNVSGYAYYTKAAYYIYVKMAFCF